MKRSEEFESYLKDSGLFFFKDFNLQHQTYFKRGGVAKFYVCPSSEDELVKLVGFCYAEHFAYKIVGGTSNLLFFDDIVYSVIISTKNIIYLHVKDTQIEVGAGYSLGDMVRVCLVNGLAGCEGLEGVPGTIGGAIYMNAGAYGFSISDSILSVKCVDNTGRVVYLDKSQCGFEYRKSIFRSESNLIIVGAIFSFSRDRKEDISKRIEIYHIARHLYQEWAYPNLGSMISLNKDIYREIFKNNFKYKVAVYVLKFILKNPLAKFLFRKNPNNKIFNKLALDYIGLNFDGRRMQKGSYRFSSKSANILINSGDYNDADFVKHALDISELTDSFDVIENEFVFYPSIKISKELKELSFKFERNPDD